MTTAAAPVRLFQLLRMFAIPNLDRRQHIC